MSLQIIYTADGNHRIGFARWELFEYGEDYGGPSSEVWLADYAFNRCPRCGQVDPLMEVEGLNPQSPIFRCQHCNEELQCGGDHPSIVVAWD